MKEGWTYKKLGEVCNIIGGGTPDRKNSSFYNGSIPWATVGDMNCEFLSSTDTCITEDGLRNSASHVIGSGEVIIATRVGLGKVCKLSQDTAINQDLKGVIPKEDNIDRGFLYYYFKEKAKYIESNGVGATVKGVKIKFVEDLDFPLIDLKVQKRIVERLDSAFENIDKLKANAEKQLSEARILFQKSLAKAMKPKEGWEERLLSEIVHPNCSLSYGIVQPGDHVENGIPVVRPVDFNNQLYVKMDGLKRTKPEISDAYQRTILKGGEILLCVRGTTGTMGIASDELIGCNVTRGIVPIYFDVDVCTKFVYYELLSPSLQDEIAHKTTGAALKQINIKDLRNLHMSIPPLAEQQRIVERLDSLSENVRKYEEIQRQMISECDALKQALLRKVFE